MWITPRIVLRLERLSERLQSIIWRIAVSRGCVTQEDLSGVNVYKAVATSICMLCALHAARRLRSADQLQWARQLRWSYSYLYLQ
jgi:hypothetical protein